MPLVFLVQGIWIFPPPPCGMRMEDAACRPYYWISLTGAFDAFLCRGLTILDCIGEAGGLDPESHAS